MINGALFQILLRGTETLPSSGKAQFYPGQLVRGKVVQLLPDQHALFQINGVKVLAKMEVEITAGDHVWLQVKSNGQPAEFKMITSVAREKGIPLSLKDGLEELIRALGIRPNPVETKLLSRMIEDNIPIQIKKWDSLTKALESLGGREEDIDLLLLTMKKGYPLSKEVLLGIKTFLQGDGFFSMAASLQQELTLLRDTSHEDQLRHLDLILSKISSKVDISSLNPHRIRQGLESIDDLNQLQKALLELKTHGYNLPANIGVREKAEQLLQFITGQQWMLQSPEGILQQIVLHVPLPPFGKQAFVQLEAKNKDNGKLDPENCRLLFCLHLTHLGDIIMDVRVYNRVVSMEVYGDQAAQIHLQDFKQELQEDLKALGYQLSILKVSENNRGEKKAPIHTIGTPYKGVDFRI